VGGKGGVGKTTCAAALAWRAARGRRTLLVSTDPASSLSDILRVPVAATPRAVRGAGRLDAANLDASAAFEAWISPRRDLLASIALRGTYLDEDDVARLLRLSLPGIDEVIGLLGISRMAANAYEVVVVDTAPTGHTLRLLASPAMLERVAHLLDALQAHHREVVSALGGGYRADSADALIAELASDATSLAALLRDRGRTELCWVTLPEPMSLEETSDAARALAETGVRLDTLIVNRVTQSPPQPCGWCAARRRFEARALAPIARRFPGVSLSVLSELEREPRGTPAVRQIAAALRPWRSRSAASASRMPLPHRVYARASGRATSAPADLPVSARWLLFGGKGGVGKTTCAAAFAIERARTASSTRVLLLSSDPAHSLADVFGVRVDDHPRPIQGAPDNLHVREIDASVGLERFRARYLDSIDAAFDGFSRGLSAAGSDRAAFRQLVDLAPPGIDEVMAIAEVAEALIGRDASYQTIVSDTAPTGHALRLLQTPAVLRDWTQALMAILLKYREVVAVGDLAALLVQLSKRLRALDGLLRDPQQTAFVLVTRAAALPGEESLRLHQTLTDLGIATGAVIVNAIGGGTCRRCRKLIGEQGGEIGRLRRSLRKDAPYAIIGTPAVMPPPHGVRALTAWASTWRRLE
jgi:arsenite-transporting ATPase